MEWFFAANIPVLDYLDIINSKQSDISSSNSDANQLWLPAAFDMNITELDLDCHLYFCLAVLCFLKHIDISG